MTVFNQEVFAPQVPLPIQFKTLLKKLTLRVRNWR